YFGADTVCAMNKYAAGRIEILPGAGITLKNAEEIVRRTQCGQIHLAHHKICYDSSTHNNRDIFFGGALYPPEDCYNVTDRNYIHTVCTTVNQA
ncbi:MAG: copper homeostasis protein CutC, partial [Ruthenibacterium sp.]